MSQRQESFPELKDKDTVFKDVTVQISEGEMIRLLQVCDVLRVTQVF